MIAKENQQRAQIVFTDIHSRYRQHSTRHKNLIQNMNDILIHFNNPRAHSVIYDVKANKMKTKMIYRLNLMIKNPCYIG